MLGGVEITDLNETRDPGIWIGCKNFMVVRRKVIKSESTQITS